MNSENELLRHLADLSPIGIIHTDRKGRFAHVNARWCQMTGYTPDWAIGREWEEVVHPEDVEGVRETWARMNEYGVPFSQEFRYMHADGRAIWVCSEAMELRDGQGRLNGYLATATEITEVRRMREEVQRCSAELEARVRERLIEWEKMAMIVAASADAIISCDMNGRIVSWNLAAERIFGYIAEQMMGETTMAITPEDRREEAEAIQHRVRKGERIDHFETLRLARNGELIDVAMSIFPLQDASGVVTGTSAVIRDIREQKAAERRLRQLSGQLLRVQDEERRRLARELHDSTAQTLAALSVNLSLLSQHGDQLTLEKRASLLNDSLTLADGVGRALRTHAYLLHPPLLEECGLPAALRWLAEGFSKRSGITVDLDLPPNLGRFDSERELTLFRVVQESLANVHRHTKSPSAQIKLQQQFDEITIEVRDEGGGEAAPNEEQPGVGIGGMRERLAQVGGSLSICLQPTGSVVRARLPIL
ncbi:PAS domain-containing sensor histidine kinase [Chthoniobacter flavus]|uniref:PAS domain-containing sensor histidine kinase n=1 Tax=Chthoniobacter flavus TaxID=191863 RepID=UPI00138AF681|nr:PAS domain S-box protein [Chthoniobacter flavus]